MNKNVRGKKRICLYCTNKFYDLNKSIITCPKCKKEQLIKKVETKISESILKTKIKEKVDIDDSLEEDVNF